MDGSGAVFLENSVAVAAPETKRIADGDFLSPFPLVQSCRDSEMKRREIDPVARKGKH